MAADLQAVGALAQMIGVVDGPAREPEHLALQLGEQRRDRCRVRSLVTMVILRPHWRMILAGFHRTGNVAFPVKFIRRCE